MSLLERSISASPIDSKQKKASITPSPRRQSLHYVEGYRIEQPCPVELQEGMLFTTKKQGDWLIVPPTTDLRLVRNEPPYVLNGAGEALRSRETPQNIVHNNELMHDRNLKFFATNWDELAPIFYDGIEVSAGLRSFTEVDLNDFAISTGQTENAGEEQVVRTAGRVDFIGEGVDGQIVIVEFGKSLHGKTNQLGRHTAGVESVIKMHNIDDPQDPVISSYIGQYDISSDYQRVQLIGPVFNVPTVKIST